ncbi:hypothetical protein, partial [Pseudoalteromonas sp. S1609]|uniref:hypothetical protein n=1 Tax=Pseudoalteromonas sp. S1609 TaxID=579505 RepID=UPI001BB1BAC1
LLNLQTTAHSRRLFIASIMAYSQRKAPEIPSLYISTGEPTLAISTVAAWMPRFIWPALRVSF